MGFPDMAIPSTRNRGILFRVATDATTNSIESDDLRAPRPKNGENRVRPANPIRGFGLASGGAILGV
jgi:hypothetical protein